MNLIALTIQLFAYYAPPNLIRNSLIINLSIKNFELLLRSSIKRVDLPTATFLLKWILISRI
jgi:hypothetical protein